MESNIRAPVLLNLLNEIGKISFEYPQHMIFKYTLIWRSAEINNFTWMKVFRINPSLVNIHFCRHHSSLKSSGLWNF